MSAELGGSQISSLLEALPGIASVLRSPVADALVRAIGAAAGVGELPRDAAEELVRYAGRRGLIGPDEGDRVLVDVEGPLKAKGGRRPPHPTKQRGAGAGGGAAAAAKRKAAKKKSRRGVGGRICSSWWPWSGGAPGGPGPPPSRPPTFRLPSLQPRRNPPAPRLRSASPPAPP